MPQKGTVWYYEWVKEIPLSGPKGKGLALLVDDEDYEFMSQFKWYAKEDRNGDITPTASLPAHRLIVPYTLTDHVNGNKFDNTRTNLREATPRQNSWNRGLRSDSRNEYKGVRFDVGRQKFRARIQVGAKRLLSRYYDSEIDAARAYDAMAREYYGVFARLNFPDEPNHEPPPPPARSCARPDCGNEFQFRPSHAIYCSRRCATIAGLRDRAARLKADSSLAPHGSLNTYSSWGCRCEPCSEAMSLYSAERYGLRKEKAA